MALRDTRTSQNLRGGRPARDWPFTLHCGHPPADYALAEQIYTYFGKNETFGLDELLAANAKHPEWQASLKEIQHKSYLDTDHRALNQEEKP